MQSAKARNAHVLVRGSKDALDAARRSCLLISCLALFACEGPSEEEQCIERIGEPPPTPRSIAADGSEDCTAPFLEHADRSIGHITSEALEIADAAREGQMLEMRIDLRDPRIPCFDPSERERAFSRAGEQITALVEQHGGVVLSSSTGSSFAVYAQLPAEQVRPAYCWPFIDFIDVACDFRNLDSASPGPSCSYDMSTATYVSPGLGEPAFRNFRPCSYEEADPRDRAPQCQD